MTPMIPGFTPMQFSTPKMQPAGGINQLALLEAALRGPQARPGAAPGAAPGVAPGAAQPGMPANGAQMGLLARLLGGGARPTPPDGMLPDVTGMAGSISGLR